MPFVRDKTGRRRHDAEPYSTLRLKLIDEASLKYSSDRRFLQSENQTSRLSDHLIIEDEIVRVFKHGSVSRRSFEKALKPV